MQVGKEKGRSRQEQRGKGGFMHLSLFLPTLRSGVSLADLEFLKGGFQHGIERARSAPTGWVWGACSPQENFWMFDLLRLFLK